MTDFTDTAIADSSGSAVITFEPINAGLCWVVSQMSLETTVFRVGCTCTIRKNGRFVTSSSLGSGDTAYGPPAIVLNRGDKLTFTWSGLQQGDEAVGTIWYTEQPWTANPDPAQVV